MENKLPLSRTPINFEQLYRNHFRMVAKLVKDFGVPSIEPDDIFQESVMILFRKSKEVDFELTAQVSTLLYGIARNVLYQHAKKKREQPLDPQAVFELNKHMPDEDGEQKSEHEKMVALVGEHLQTLEGDCRNLLSLVYLEKTSYRAIGERMGYTEGFVKVKKFRCLDYLRKKVKADKRLLDLRN